jgi:hydroxymethylglutaryl-CoA lyase
MVKEKIAASLKIFKNLVAENKIKIPKKVRVVEVGPRDGLQNEPKVITTEFKLGLIEGLVNCGIRHVEVGSFVSPKWVPQMANTNEVLKRLKINPGTTYSVLVPNAKGLELALETKANEYAIFTAASESFCKKNINCSIDESIDKFADIMKAAKEHQIKVRGYVSCVMGCPYEGEINPDIVNKVAQRLLDIGCYEVSLGDTIGIGTPEKTERMFNAITIPTEKLAVHFHDTAGTALENIMVALSRGISVMDSSVGGLGGCPYAKKSVGNVATENVVEMLDFLNIETGIDLKALKLLGQKATKELDREVTYIFE